MSEQQQTGEQQQAPEAPKPPEQGDDGKSTGTFTQADVDRIVQDRLQRERAKFADYDDLKSGARTAEERITELERRYEEANREALRRRVQAAHGISDEDADLFLTGTDEESLTAQAKRLAERESQRKQQNNVSPREGTNPAPGQDQMREFVHNVFGTRD